MPLTPCAARVPSYASALACYRSPEYQRAKPLRLPHSVCDFVIIEGYDGVQPSQPAAPPATSVRKGYWIGHVDVTDPDGYKGYVAANGAPFGRFGARFLVRGGARETVEGRVRARTVVLEFPSYAIALACYRSPDYQSAAELRKGRQRSISSSSRATTAHRPDERVMEGNALEEDVRASDRAGLTTGEASGFIRTGPSRRLRPERSGENRWPTCG